MTEMMTMTILHRIRFDCVRERMWTDSRIAFQNARNILVNGSTLETETSLAFSPYNKAINFILMLVRSSSCFGLVFLH